jgi:hypothetical protein
MLSVLTNMVREVQTIVLRPGLLLRLDQRSGESIDDRNEPGRSVEILLLSTHFT